MEWSSVGRDTGLDFSKHGFLMLVQLEMREGQSSSLKSMMSQEVAVTRW